MKIFLRFAIFGENRWGNDVCICEIAGFYVGELSFFRGLAEYSGVIEAIAAIANLILVIFFFFKEQRDYRKRENARIQEQTHDKWYDLLVRERVMKTLDQYYERVGEIVSDSEKYTGGQSGLGEWITAVQDIKEVFAQSKRIFLPILSFFDDDLKDSVWKEIQENHDQILIRYEEYMQGNISSRRQIFEIMNEDRANAYKKLYEYDFKKLKETIHF